MVMGDLERLSSEWALAVQFKHSNRPSPRGTCAREATEIAVVYICSYISPVSYDHTHLHYFSRSSWYVSSPFPSTCPPRRRLLLHRSRRRRNHHRIHRQTRHLHRQPIAST